MSDREPRPAAEVEDVRTGLGPEAIRRDYLDNLRYVQGLLPDWATPNDRYLALAYAVRDRLLTRWLHSSQTVVTQCRRRLCYFSAEYLPGPHLGHNLLSLGIEDGARQAMDELGLDLDELLALEEEPALGNGGLGRLAACFLESLATLELPAVGYGLRYEFGIFSQSFRDGWQVETSDRWLRLGNPWEIARPQFAQEVKLGGHTEAYHDAAGRYRVRWIPRRVVKGVACDTPVLGYGSGYVNLLRLWKSEAPESFDFQAFNRGDYYRAVDDKVQSESLSKVLYPNDELRPGKYLRLVQQYFLVSCSLQDMLQSVIWSEGDPRRIADRCPVQLNDTHPAIAIAELMRLLIDEHGLGWEEAWAITRRCFHYTNHTLLPEALEQWPVHVVQLALPRPLEIIYEINRRFLDEVRSRWPGDDGRVARMSLIDERGERYLRMAHLACVGSQSINGVSRLHTELLEQKTLRDFHELWPEKFNNKTNGVSPRRFVVLCNRPLARLISDGIGTRWITDLGELRRLEPLAEDAEFRARWRAVKLQAKAALAEQLRGRCGVEASPQSLFDIQAKRIHEYKRQHLNALHVIALYNRLLRQPADAGPPRTVVFAGKAAPGYFMAKLIIKLIHSIAHTVNGDPSAADRLRVAFFPDFNVKNAQLLYPAADLSEQISTAGWEASGTGNMKFALNGALTIGTLDGANVELREEVGAENFFLFGMTAEQVAMRRAEGYDPFRHYSRCAELREAIDQVAAGRFADGDRGLFRPLVDEWLGRDQFMVLADFEDYARCQREVERAYADTESWTRRSILTVARMGRFSSDRAVLEYAEDIWRLGPVHLAAGDRPLQTGAL